jgi:hypothetical protein
MSPFSRSSRWVAASGTWRTTTRRGSAFVPQYPSQRSSVYDSLAFQLTSLNGPDPAEFVLSHSFPKSPPCSCDWTVFMSTTPPMTAVRQ